MNNNKNIQKKIFIIDDEQPITIILNRCLSEEGYDVDTAHDIEEAKGKIDNNDFDLIISDIVIGDNSGIDLLREVKERKLTCFGKCFCSL